MYDDALYHEWTVEEIRRSLELMDLFELEDIRASDLRALADSHRIALAVQLGRRLERGTR